MKSVSSFNLVDKGKRHHKRHHPGLPALIPGAGRVVSNGALRVELPAVNGETFVYRATPRTEWLFTLERSFERSFVNAKPHPAVSPSDRVKAAIDLALGVLGDLDARRAALAQPSTTDIVDE